MSMLCNVVASDITGSAKVDVTPDHTLSGNLVDGGIWELKVYCSSTSDFGEHLHGTLTVNGTKQEPSEPGLLFKATLGELKYFGKKSNPPKTVTGWYFSDWPQTCSYLPK